MTALCECGCGEPAPIHRYSSPRRGYVIGQPARFIAGHNARLPQRFEMRDCGYQTPCQIYLGSRNGFGHGRCNLKRPDGETLIHRIEWITERGPVPAGKELHHLCTVPACARTDHLVLVTRREHCRIHAELRRAAA